MTIHENELFYGVLRLQAAIEIYVSNFAEIRVRATSWKCLEVHRVVSIKYDLILLYVFDMLKLVILTILYVKKVHKFGHILRIFRVHCNDTK